MGLFKLFRKKNKEANCSTNETEREATFVESAEKTADIISSSINDGKFAEVTEKLERISAARKEKERFVFDTPPKKRWIVALIACFILSIVFLYFLIISSGIVFFSSEYRALGGSGIVIILSILIVNIIVCRKAITEIHFARRYDQYQNVLRYRNIEIVDDLAYMIEVDRRIVENDLTKAMREKLIPEGHFGRDNVIFMTSDAVFNAYSKRRAVFDRYFKKKIEERNRMKERSRETEELLQQGEEYIGKIRDSNEIIKDKEISKKLDRMERVVATIFHEVDINPAQAKKLGVFLEYYLPTTEKLLESYIELDEKAVKGKHTEQTKKDISKALDSINNAFEGLLDRFYQEQEREVVSEIFAMETIMKQEGLQDDGES